MCSNRDPVQPKTINKGRASPVAHWVKNPPAMQKTQETQVQSLSWDDLEEGMATHVFLPGKLHEQRSMAGYSLWDHKRATHDCATEHTGDAQNLAKHICGTSEKPQEVR